jgi:electron transport complex protein RnfC
MSVRAGFPAGLRLPAHKALAMRHAIRALPAPARACVALDQGSGDAATPVVEAGTRVCIGTRIARASDGVSVPLHSPIAGTVRSIERRETPSAAGSGLCIVIDNDGTESRDPRCEPLPWEALAAPELLAKLADAGIAGLGGAAFPTAAKLAAARAGSALHLVLNGAECEPWICCDDALMRERAADVLLGARVMLKASGAQRCTIAIEDDKPEAIGALQAALSAVPDERIVVRSLPSMYPAGAERQLLLAVTGEELPHDARPTSVGLLCQNVGTAAAVARFVTTGEPAIRRVVTMTGSGVAEPANLEARIGTPLAELVAACGGYQGQPRRLIVGGNMTGRAVASDEIPLTLAVMCAVAADDADLGERGREMPCIRCGDCARVCPVGLLPQQLHRAAAAGDEPALVRHGIADCIECGCCDYVCPSRIPLTARFHVAREQVRLHQAGRNHAAELRARFERHERRLAEAAAAERAAFEEARRRARAAQDG